MILRPQPKASLRACGRRGIRGRRGHEEQVATLNPEGPPEEITQDLANCGLLVG